MLGVSAHVNLPRPGAEGIEDYRALAERLSHVDGCAQRGAGDLSDGAAFRRRPRARRGDQGNRSGTRSRTDEALRRIVSGAADFTPDADGFDSIVVGHLMADELNMHTGRLRHADQSRRASDSLRHGAALAALSHRGHIRFRLLRLRRQLGVRHDGRGAKHGRRRRRGQRAGVSHAGCGSRRGSGSRDWRGRRPGIT